MSESQRKLMTQPESLQEQEAKDSIQNIERIGIAALQNAFVMHNTLGRQGLEVSQKNQFGDTQLTGDVSCEQAVLEILRNNNLPVVVYSEEHGNVTLNDDPKYLAVLDGIDGTAVYKKALGTGRYATLFGIFANTDPRYRDYFFSGIMEHATARLFYALKGKGAFVRDLTTGATEVIKCKNTQDFDPENPQKIKLYADINLDKVFNETIVQRIVAELKHQIPENFLEVAFLNATAPYYSDLVSGKADGIIDWTRKGNLEMAAAHGLVIEAGGAVMTLDGVTIENRKYLEFGQDKNERIPIISAATETLARNITERLARIRSHF